VNTLRVEQPADWIGMDLLWVDVTRYACSALTLTTGQLVYRLLLIVAVIVYGSLYPWHFAPQNQNPFLALLHSWPETWDIFATRDAILNISVYFPLGVAAFLAMSKKLSRSAAGTAALVAGLILSVTLEVFQVYVPGRVSSIFDVLCNFIGTAAGVLATLRFQSALEELDLRSSRRFEPSAVVLLACWGVYHFFPFLPMISLERLRFELRLLAHPCDSRYCCCTASAYLSGIWAGAAEWFVVALSLEALQIGRAHV
jgi:VanZ family protein